MSNDMILTLIAWYDKSIAGTEAASKYEVVDRTEINDDAEFVIVNCGESKCGESFWWGFVSVIVYNDGTLFVPTDWDASPTAPEDVENCEWRDITTGFKGIMIGGLPRRFL